MKFTLNWLREFVRVEQPAHELANLLTMAGLEVESLVRLQEPHSEKEDWLFEVSVTPNRGDCLSVMGLAREVSALAGRAYSASPGQLQGQAVDVLAGVSIAIENPVLCPRYSAAIAGGLEIGLTPEWMKFRLEVCGIRSINNVVDITNYVMLETGQPLHAFDLERIESHRIVVRTAAEPAKFVTLDGVERQLTAEDLLICDGHTPIALAGIMGGIHSEVVPETRRTLLESAHFDPIVIRRTAKRLGLHSEASHRFERGVDPQGTTAALARALFLLSKLAKATPVGGYLDCFPRPGAQPVIELRQARVEKLLGNSLPRAQIERMLHLIGLTVHSESNAAILKVIPPSYRSDLTREADIIEELARLHGYDKIPSTLPRLASSGGKPDLLLMRERNVRAFLAGEGFSEVINLPFTNAKTNRLFPGLWEGPPSPVTVLNPLVKDNSEMRLSLVPGLLDNLRYNLAQKAPGFFAYHLGNVFRSVPDGDTQERQYLSAIMYGPRARSGLRPEAQAAPGFLDCKGVVEGILDSLQIAVERRWSKESNPVLHPGRAAALFCEGTKLAYLGQIHPDVCDEMDLPAFVLSELDFEGLLQYAPRQITVRSLPRFPSVERDFAVVIDREFPSQRIVDWIRGLNLVLIERVEVFDQYSGSPIAQGKKSLAYKISYRAEDRTLTDTEVNALHQDLLDRLSKTFDAQLRT